MRKEQQKSIKTTHSKQINRANTKLTICTQTNFQNQIKPNSFRLIFKLNDINLGLISKLYTLRSGAYRLHFTFIQQKKNNNSNNTSVQYSVPIKCKIYLDTYSLKNEKVNFEISIWTCTCVYVCLCNVQCTHHIAVIHIE